MLMSFVLKMPQCFRSFWALGALSRFLMYFKPEARPGLSSRVRYALQLYKTNNVCNLNGKTLGDKDLNFKASVR